MASAVMFSAIDWLLPDAMKPSMLVRKIAEASVTAAAGQAISELDSSDSKPLQTHNWYLYNSMLGTAISSVVALRGYVTNDPGEMAIGSILLLSCVVSIIATRQLSFLKSENAMLQQYEKDNKEAEAANQTERKLDQTWADGTKKLERTEQDLVTILNGSASEQKQELGSLQHAVDGLNQVDETLDRLVKDAKLKFQSLEDEEATLTKTTGNVKDFSVNFFKVMTSLTDMATTINQQLKSLLQLIQAKALLSEQQDRLVSSLDSSSLTKAVQDFNSSAAKRDAAYTKLLQSTGKDKHL